MLEIFMFNNLIYLSFLMLAKYHIHLFKTSIKGFDLSLLYYDSDMGFEWNYKLSLYRFINSNEDGLLIFQLQVPYIIKLQYFSNYKKCLPEFYHCFGVVNK